MGDGPRFSYQMTESWDVTDNMATTANNTVTYLKAANRVDLKISHHKEKNVF